MTAIKTIVLAGVLVGVPAQLPATAKPAPAAARAAVVQAISDCRKVAGQTERLACYDKAADAFDQAQAEGQVVVVDREQVRTVRRQSFGFNIPSMAVFTRGPKEAPIDNVKVELASAHANGDGKWVMTTTDGAVWAATENASFSDDPHRGSKVTIRRGILGAYFCNVDGEQTVRCERAR